MKLFRTPNSRPLFAIRGYATKPGERFPVIGNYSECAMHMRLSDKQVEIELKHSTRANENGYYYPSAQFWKDGREFSSSVTTGEAGFYCAGESYYRDGKGLYYTYVDESRLTWSQLGSIGTEEEEQRWLASINGTTSPGCPLSSTPTEEPGETASPIASEPPKKLTPSLRAGESVTVVTRVEAPVA